MITYLKGTDSSVTLEIPLNTLTEPNALISKKTYKLQIWTNLQVLHEKSQ